MSDIEIRLGGEVWRMRPTFGAMREIEAATNSSTATLIEMLRRDAMHVSEMAIIVFSGMEAAGGRPTDYEAIGKRLFEEGVGSKPVREKIAAYLFELLYAPDEAKKKSALDAWRKSEAAISQILSLARTASDGDRATFGDLPLESSGASSPPTVKDTTRPPEPAQAAPDAGEPDA